MSNDNFWYSDSKKPLYMISSCGTSLLTNGVGQEERAMLIKYANCSKMELSEELRGQIMSIADKKKQELLNASPDEVRRLSAEMNGILGYFEIFPEKQGSATHGLLVSSTFLGELVGDILKEWFEKNGYSAYIVPVSDIVTTPLEKFQSGLCDLVRFCEEDLNQDANHVVFNVTGGFKSVQGFLQTLGLFYADECISIFENRKDLLRIPKLPAQISVSELVKDNLALFRALDRKSSVPSEETQKIPETLLTTVGDESTFSGWGKLMWEQAKKELYAEKIWPIESDRVRLGDRFLKSCEGLTSKRMQILNRRLDDLMSHLESDDTSGSIRSLDFKPIRPSGEAQRKHPGMTHEFDAWADEDAKRCFGRFDKEDQSVFIVEKLDKGLH